MGKGKVAAVVYIGNDAYPLKLKVTLFENCNCRQPRYDVWVRETREKRKSVQGGWYIHTSIEITSRISESRKLVSDFSILKNHGRQGSRLLTRLVCLCITYANGSS